MFPFETLKYVRICTTCNVRKFREIPGVPMFLGTIPKPTLAGPIFFYTPYTTTNVVWLLSSTRLLRRLCTVAQLRTCPASFPPLPEISRVENLEKLTRLSNLDLFCNRLGSVPGSLDGLALLTRLKDLDISENSM